MRHHVFVAMNEGVIEMVFERIYQAVLILLLAAALALVAQRIVTGLSSQAAMPSVDAVAHH
ncbi:MAG: hypothetical protein ACK4XJ_01690 [Fimbriimonadaceae bacterium]